MMQPIEIAGRKIGPGQAPYVIAELSANHNGNIDTAFRLIDIAKASGAAAIKIQTYRADTITLKSNHDDFQIHDGLWKGKTLYELYESAFTPWEWHKPLFEHAALAGITIFSSPFDHTAIDLLEDLGAPAYKIASFEAVDLRLIKYAASTGKPLIISTGMADREEIDEAFAVARDGGCEQLCLLLCVSGYPAPASDYNLATIADMADRYKVPIGLSDHTLANTTAVASVALGAALIEKHVTLDRNGGGPDDSFSLEPPELESLCRAAHAAWEAVGRVDYGRKSSEIENVKFRRSLYFVRDLKAGATVTEADIRSVRPGFGLAPKHFDTVVGKTVRIDINAPAAVRWEDID